MLKGWGLRKSAAITTLKPSGTVSQLVNSSSGIHPRYAPYYIRRIRNNKLDPLSQHLVEMGIPNELREDENNYVFSFPMKTPETSITTERMNAMNQLELWKMYADNWCEHNPSCTVYYNEDDFLEVGGWVYKNFNSIAGISFLPIDDHTYEAPPLEKINKREYDAMVRDFPEEVNFEFGEELDNTIGSQEMACKGNSCEII